jgi:hypothetical protein
MALENFKKKTNEEKKPEKGGPYKLVIRMPLKNGKSKIVVKEVSREECLAYEREQAYVHNPEDPTFESEMSGEW